jgi:hypothetical protein
LGNDVIPIGDVGKCNQAGIQPGDLCPRAQSTQTPDGRPDVVISSLSVDLPLHAPDPAFGNAGVAYLIDGATAAILHTYVHPEPQAGANFGGTFEHTIAAGDMGDTGLPDVQLGAPNQNARYTAGGRSYVMDGNFKASASLLTIARLDDPTPDPTEENFGGSSAGVGDLVGGAATPANELMVGESGPRVGPVNVEGRPIDIHFFNPSLEQPLQSVQDPDAQSSSAFGDSIEPLGDLNEDGFLDFAVGAFRYSGSGGINQGRAYIFRSDNSPAPSQGGPPAANSPGAVTRAGRTITLSVSKSRVSSGRSVSLKGKITALTNSQSCATRQSVSLQRRRSARRGAFKTFTTTRSGSNRAFSKRIRPRRTYTYRARVGTTTRCLGAVSRARSVRVASARRR